MEQDKIGKFIADARKKKKMTQAMLAEKLGVSDKTIGNWENGRNMPDLSLFKPLCECLDISIYELLNGERLSDDSDIKKEEAIYKTIDYTKNAITHEKRVFKTILAIIIILVGTLITLFLIDINRMRNNKPVFFSTWGYLYTPAINLDSVKIENTIKNYLIEESEENKHHDNEKSFVSMKTYLISEQKDKYYIYSWVLENSYYVENSEIKLDSGYSMPFKFEVMKKDDGFIVTNKWFPRDGSYYKTDMKKIFPNDVLKEINNFNYDGTEEELKDDIDNQIKLYFH